MPDHSLALAPMEGVTDAVLRRVYAALGGVDWCVTEFLRVSATVLPAHMLLRACPELRVGGTAGEGVPVHLQLLGGDPARVAATALVAAELGARHLDLNFGCPAPTVNRHDGGASLLRDPARVEAVTRAVRDALPREVTVSAKVRLGWDDADAVVTIARCAEQGGAAWLTVHGRTRAQGYAPPADWERIGRAAGAVRIPVVANGDLVSPDAVAECARVTGCSRFMLGRGAIARPELFRVLRGWEGFWEPTQRAGVLLWYARWSMEGGEERERVTLARCKQWLRAMADAAPELGPLFQEFKRKETLASALELLRAQGFKEPDGRGPPRRPRDPRCEPDRAPTLAAP